MVDLTPHEVQALARAAGLTIQEPDLTNVTQRLNVLWQALEAIDLPELDGVEPLPMLGPHP